MNITLCGYGVVGKGVEKLCDHHENFQVQYIYVRKEKENLPKFSNDMAIVEAPEIDLVVECLNGIEPANTIIRKALQAGKHVVTSNKAVIATYLEEYLAIAKKHHTTIQVEACVAGGIPFLDALLKAQRLEPIQGFEGILNGTSNYILDQMQKNGLSYEVALEQAQEKGYAEKDPTNDVEGIDVWYKTNIANMLAYQTKKVELPQPIGISKLQEEDIQLAKRHQKIIRHVAISRCRNEKVASVIIPAYLNTSDYLANVPDNYNAQIILAPSFDTLGYFGQGAGQLATAQAIMQNALDTLDHTERPIELLNQYTWDPTMIQENWIVRTTVDLHSYFTIDHQENNTYWIHNQDLRIIDTIHQIDKKAMIAIWR